MKTYYDDMEAYGTPPWMTLFISLMLVVLTLFIFLTTFTETDKTKLEIFKKHFRKSMLMPREDRKGTPSIIDLGGPVEPISAIVNRMKSEGINKKLMDDFLTLSQIKGLEVMDGTRGVVVIVPEVAYFEEGTKDLTKTSRQFLARLLFLVEELPYLVEIKGYAVGTVPAPYKDALEFSAMRAMEVFNYFIQNNIPPIKLKVAGCGDAFENAAKPETQPSPPPQNKVEIIFKEAEL